MLITMPNIESKPVIVVYTPNENCAIGNLIPLKDEERKSRCNFCTSPPPKILSITPNLITQSIETLQEKGYKPVGFKLAGRCGDGLRLDNHTDLRSILVAFTQALDQPASPRQIQLITNAIGLAPAEFNPHPLYKTTSVPALLRGGCNQYIQCAQEERMDTDCLYCYKKDGFYPPKEHMEIIISFDPTHHNAACKDRKITNILDFINPKSADNFSAHLCLYLNRILSACNHLRKAEYPIIVNSMCDPGKITIPKPVLDLNIACESVSDEPCVTEVSFSQLLTKRGINLNEEIEYPSEQARVLFETVFNILLSTFIAQNGYPSPGKKPFSYNSSFEYNEEKRTGIKFFLGSPLYRPQDEERVKTWQGKTEELPQAMNNNLLFVQFVQDENMPQMQIFNSYPALLTNQPSQTINLPLISPES